MELLILFSFVFILSQILVSVAFAKGQIVLATIYIDDSGTSPSQAVAIATAFVVPAAQIVCLTSEWETFRTKERFSDFHTSESIHSTHSKSPFSDWDSAKRQRVFARVRQIAKKYGTRAVSIAVYKKDYDEITPQKVKEILGSHYTWAVRQLIAFLTRNVVSSSSQYPREFIFDRIGNKSTDTSRREIETVMEQAQWDAKQRGVEGDYLNYSFRNRAELPGLQCADAIGWTCYCNALHLFLHRPLHELAALGWKDFRADQGASGWLAAITILRSKLEKTMTEERTQKRIIEMFEKWEKR